MDEKEKKDTLELFGKMLDLKFESEELIEKADDDTKAQIEELIAGKTIEKVIHEDITYDEIYDSMDNLYNFMLFTGYFKFWKIVPWQIKSTRIRMFFPPVKP